jgi:hypothetical protein
MEAAYVIKSYWREDVLARPALQILPGSGIVMDLTRKVGRTTDTKLDFRKGGSGVVTFNSVGPKGLKFFQVRAGFAERRV